jgi:hypothetical protein
MGTRPVRKRQQVFQLVDAVSAVDDDPSRPDQCYAATAKAARHQTRSRRRQ